MASLKGILFDFDGLLCDTEQAAWRSWVELYRRFGLEFPDELWPAMVGHRDGESLGQADLSARLAHPPGEQLWRARRERKTALAHRQPLRPGAWELIREATRRGLRIAVVSSSSRDWVGGHLTRLGIVDEFAVIVCGQDVSLPKPAPDGYNIVLEKLGLDPAEAVALEDSLAGVTAARAAGVRCVAVPGPRSGPVAHHADLVVASLSHLNVSTLERLGGP
ncbi:MAG TPA: HAD family phosphatase [Candidatus Limnocylindrales bacterium]|nr:HAD family phosphatase [Candidatus Limnocylindrales bacterium]